jgi:hypothetical protein
MVGKDRGRFTHLNVKLESGYLFRDSEQGQVGEKDTCNAMVFDIPGSRSRVSTELLELRYICPKCTPAAPAPDSTLLFCPSCRCLRCRNKTPPQRAEFRNALSAIHMQLMTVTTMLRQFITICFSGPPPFKTILRFGVQGKCPVLYLAIPSLNDVFTVSYNHRATRLLLTLGTSSSPIPRMTFA